METGLQQTASLPSFDFSVSRQRTPQYDDPMHSPSSMVSLAQLVTQVHMHLSSSHAWPLSVRPCKTHLLIGKDQENRISELVFCQHSLQLLLSFGNTFSVIAIHNEYKSYSEQMTKSQVRWHTHRLLSWLFLTYIHKGMALALLPCVF